MAGGLSSCLVLCPVLCASSFGGARLRGYSDCIRRRGRQGPVSSLRSSPRLALGCHSARDPRLPVRLLSYPVASATPGPELSRPGNFRPNGETTMDKANFEIVGNVGKVEIKTFGKTGKLATLSVATSERWKTEDGASREKTYWHRVTVFAPALIARIEAMVQKGSRVRLLGRIRPGSYDDDKGRTRYVIEFVLGPFAELEILARGKPKAETADAEQPMEVAA